MACPPIVLNSVDLKTLVDLMSANDLAGAADFLVREIDVLAQRQPGV